MAYSYPGGMEQKPGPCRGGPPLCWPGPRDMHGVDMEEGWKGWGGMPFIPSPMPGPIPGCCMFMGLGECCMFMLTFMPGCDWPFMPMAIAC